MPISLGEIGQRRVNSDRSGRVVSQSKGRLDRAFEATYGPQEKELAAQDAGSGHPILGMLMAGADVDRFLRAQPVTPGNMVTLCAQHDVVAAEMLRWSSFFSADRVPRSESTASHSQGRAPSGLVVDDMNLGELLAFRDGLRQEVRRIQAAAALELMLEEQVRACGEVLETESQGGAA